MQRPLPGSLVIGLLAVLGACADDGSALQPSNDGPTDADAGAAAGGDAALTPTPDASVPETTAPRPSCAAKSGSPGTKMLTLTSGGMPRTSIVHAPAVVAAEPMPLILNFHGFTQHGASMELTSRMDGASDKHRFVVAYPDGLSQSWNAGDCCTQFALPSPGNVDDVLFTKDLIAKLSEQYCIDPKRIYATGLSNGALFSYRLACDMADVIAAIAPVAGSMPIETAACKPKRPVPILHFHANTDAFEPFDGGAPAIAGLLGELFVTFRSVPDSIAAWRKLDACPETSKVVFAQGDVSCDEWSGCAGGSAIRLCKISDGGHTWPGGAEDPDYAILGKITTDIDATETMVKFFADHPLP